MGSDRVRFHGGVVTSVAVIDARCTPRLQICSTILRLDKIDGRGC